MATPTTRAKDPKIVAESQKVFGVIKNVFVTLFVFFLVLIVIRWGQEKAREAGERAKAETTAQKATPAPPQQWQLCWEKKPEHTGKTGIRQLCLPALVETRTPARIVISYSYSGGQGVMEGTSIDGSEYDGQWKDSTGWGKWHLKFVSSDTAFGWSDDEGTGEKVPNVLEVAKAASLM